MYGKWKVMHHIRLGGSGDFADNHLVFDKDKVFSYQPLHKLTGIHRHRSHKRPTMLVLKTIRSKNITNVLIPESIGRYDRQYTICNAGGLCI